MNGKNVTKKANDAPISLYAYLIRLIWFCVAPLIALAVFLAGTYLYSVQKQQKQEVANILNSTCSVFNQYFSMQVAALQVLATSPLANNPSQVKKFYLESQGYHKNFDGEVILADLSLQMIFNTRAPFGTALPKLPRPKGRAAVPIVLATGSAAVGDMFYGPIAKEMLVAIAVPVLSKKETKAILLSVVKTSELQKKLGQLNFPQGWTVSLIDSAGGIVGNNAAGEANSQSTGPDFSKHFTADLAFAPWSIRITIPFTVYYAPLITATASLAAMVLAIALISIISGRLASRKLAQSLSTLTDDSQTAFLPIAEIESARFLLQNMTAAEEEAKKTLQYSESRFRATFEQAAVGIAHVALDGRWLRVNQKLCDIVGYTNEEMLRMTFQDITYQEDIESDVNDMRRLEIGETVTYSKEKRYLHKDGSIVWIRLTVSLAHDGLSSIKYFISVIEDITARKYADAALQYHEHLLRETGRIAKIGGWEFDPETRKGTWTEEVARIHDLDPEDKTSLDVGLSFYQGEHKLKIEKAIDEAIRYGKPYNLELELVTRTGKHKWVHAIGNPVIVDGKVVQIEGAFQDITDGKCIENKLRKSEEEFRRLSQEFQGLLDAIPDNLMLIDRDFKILWANKGSRAFFGVSPEEIIGKHCYAIDGKTESPCAFCYPQDCFFTEQPVNKAITRANGRTWDMRAVPLLDEQGHAEKVIIVNRDVTEHRKLEEQYLQAQKMESIGTLAGGIAHDFNNILSAIIGYGHLILTQVDQNDSRRSNLESMLEAADRAAHLTRDLLLFSRKQASERRVVNLNEIVSHVEKFLKRIIGEDIVCNLGIEKHPLMVNADTHQIEQVLMNLATNARDAMPHGGTFDILTKAVDLDEKETVFHNISNPGSYAMLTIADTGEGIDKEKQKHIFEPFFTTKGVGKGTGLGLAVVYGIIKQHDGFINVYSESNIGTTFKIYLPLLASQDDKDDKIIEHAGEKISLSGTEIILLAEDDIAVRNLTQTILAEYGYTVIEAVDGEDAVRKFKDHASTIDLLLFDVIMPKLSGKEAYDEIQKMHANIKAVFISGYAPESILQKTLLPKTVQLILKPISPLALLQKIRSTLDENTAVE